MYLLFLFFESTSPLFHILYFSTKSNLMQKSIKTGLQSSKNPGKLRVPRVTKVRFGIKKEMILYGRNSNRNSEKE